MRSFGRVSLFLCTGTVLAFWILEAADSCDLCLFPHLRAQAEAIEQMRQQRNAFMPRVADLVERLGSGQVGLREASQTFCRDAAANHPRYLKFFTTINEFNDVETKVAHHLLNELLRNADSTHAEQLEREFESMLADD